MQYDPIAWLDGRVTQAEAKLDNRITKTEESVKDLEKFKDKAILWCRVGAFLACVLVNMKVGDATEILVALAKALLK